MLDLRVIGESATGSFTGLNDCRVERRRAIMGYCLRDSAAATEKKEIQCGEGVGKQK
jgi:hypothetical protein